MADRPVRIGIVAPAGRMDESAAEKVMALARGNFGSAADLHFHDQCFLRGGHFAGPDDKRADALVDVANDPSIDAVWFARGGYGSVRIVDDVVGRLSPVARRKTWLGYSDLGTLLAALRVKSFPLLAHGPMPADILRPGGDAAVLRGLRFLVSRDADTVEPQARGAETCLAFNMTILSKLIGTQHFPDVAGQVLMLEEVSEYMYSIDRSMAHIVSNAAVRKAAGIRLGRCTLVPPNEPDFGMSEVEVVEFWCKKSGIPYLGRADIGHDAANKVVPFGGLEAFLSVA